MLLLIKMNFFRKILIFIILFIPVFCNGQFDTVQFKVNPEFPEANQDVSISIESYSTDLNRSEISWYKNNSLVQRSVGEKTFSFRTRGLGSVDTITVRVDGVLKNTFTIRPAEVDLVWEANTYTPPFYKGKALNSNQATLKIIAIPHIVSSSGNKFSPNSLIYTWKKDWKVLGNESGYGRDVLVLDGLDIYNKTIITVEAKNQGGSIIAQKRIILNNQDSKIVFYEDDPLLGVLYENDLDKNFNLDKEEINIKAVPLFLSNEELDSGNIRYSWTMNSKKLTNLESQDYLVLRKGEHDGTTQLSLEITNLKKVMQFVRNSLGISFENVEETNIFGF